VIRRVLLVALCGLHCAGTAATSPRPVGVETSFTRAPLVADCVEMARAVPADDDWQMEVYRAQEPALALFPPDGRWILHLSVPPPRTGLDHHEIDDLTLTCGSERISLQSVACRGHGLNLYVDSTPVAGRTLGTLAATCHLSLVIDGASIDIAQPILVRPGLRAWFADQAPEPKPAEGGAP
jgi:hypothetical protein